MRAHRTPELAEREVLPVLRQEQQQQPQQPQQQPEIHRRRPGSSARFEEAQTRPRSGSRRVVLGPRGPWELTSCAS